MEGVEIGDAVNAENDGLAIDDELLFAVLARSVDNPGKTLTPVVAAARDQTDAIAVALDPQAKAGA
jgi:hypothetical protein